MCHNSEKIIDVWSSWKFLEGLKTKWILGPLILWILDLYYVILDSVGDLKAKEIENSVIFAR